MSLLEEFQATINELRQHSKATSPDTQEWVIVVHPQIYAKLQEELKPYNNENAVIDTTMTDSLMGYEVYVEDKASPKHIEFMTKLQYIAKYRIRL